MKKADFLSDLHALVVKHRSEMKPLAIGTTYIDTRSGHLPLPYWAEEFREKYKKDVKTILDDILNYAFSYKFQSSQTSKYGASHIPSQVELGSPPEMGLFCSESQA